MIKIISGLESILSAELLVAAFERSCGKGSVVISNIDGLTAGGDNGDDIWVFQDPKEVWSEIIIRAFHFFRVKILIFGSLSPSLAKFLDVSVAPITAEILDASNCISAQPHQFSESIGTIIYTRTLISTEPILPSRALCRYDFSDEWNNLGFGAIRGDDPVWGLSQCAEIPSKNVVAYVSNSKKNLSAYCGVWDFISSGLLWFNRSVGPIDSFEWRLVETYLSGYRFNELPSSPVLMEIPYGYASASTMRLDCDEDIESARALWLSYCELGIPFSLALHASVLGDAIQHSLPKEVLDKGGSILSHTLTHASNWGGSFEGAYYEGVESSNIIERVVGIRPSYAVSPFHQTPEYARRGLSAAGYKGCIGGIICNDPDYLLARGGRPPFINSLFIGHTQQCMLHGDCLLSEGDPLKIYKEAFDLAFISKTLFGFLDHPFSARYQYGWSNEDERIYSHRELINYIIKKNKSHLFLSEDQALDFLSDKASIEISNDGQDFVIFSKKFDQSKYLVGVEFGGKTYPINNGNFRLRSTLNIKDSLN